MNSSKDPEGLSKRANLIYGCTEAGIFSTRSAQDGIFGIVITLLAGVAVNGPMICKIPSLSLLPDVRLEMALCCSCASCTVSEERREQQKLFLDHSLLIGIPLPPWSRPLASVIKFLNMFNLFQSLNFRASCWNLDWYNRMKLHLKGHWLPHVFWNHYFLT